MDFRRCLLLGGEPLTDVTFLEAVLLVGEAADLAMISWSSTELLGHRALRLDPLSVRG